MKERKIMYEIQKLLLDWWYRLFGVIIIAYAWDDSWLTAKCRQTVTWDGWASQPLINQNGLCGCMTTPIYTIHRVKELRSLKKIKERLKISAPLLLHFCPPLLPPPKRNFFCTISPKPFLSLTPHSSLFLSPLAPFHSFFSSIFPL